MKVKSIENPTTHNYSYDQKNGSYLEFINFNVFRRNLSTFDIYISTHFFTCVDLIDTEPHLQWLVYLQHFQTDNNIFYL